MAWVNKQGYLLDFLRDVGERVESWERVGEQGVLRARCPSIAKISPLLAVS
jgi:hypothetical protein